MIISILNQKGGVGKTTLSTHLSRALVLDNQKVLLIDSDPQGSSRDWNSASGGELVPVVGLDRPTLDKDIKAVESGYDWILIDGAPQVPELMISAIKASDIVLIPVTPSPYDVWSTGDLVEAVKARRELMDGKPKACFIISRKIVGTTIGREVTKALEEYELPILQYGTSQRVIFATSAVNGSTALDEEPNGQASLEIRRVLKEIRKFADVG